MQVVLVVYMTDRDLETLGSPQVFVMLAVLRIE
jgi:hypothetical protein